MQPPLCKNRHNLPRFQASISVASLFIGITGFLTLPGCVGDSNPITTSEAKPFSKVALVIRCPDSNFAAALAPAIRSWAERTGANISIQTEQMRVGDNTDVGILPVSELGTWAERGELVRLPTSLRTETSFQLSGVLPTYREQLIEWGGQAQAITLAGDGFIIVYRTDRLSDAMFIQKFQELFGRKPAVPTTWEEFADIAIAFAALDGKPSLPPMNSSEVADLFFRVAACYDRSAVIDPKAKQGPALSFQFDLISGDPRLDTPGFHTAANWLARLAEKKCFPPIGPVGTASDAAPALSDGRASLGMLALSQLGKLPRENGVVPARIGLTALAGTRMFTDPDKKVLVPAPVPNYIPYFTGGQLGVVRTRCENQEAAFDLLAELGGPVRSLEVLSTTELGAGPYRIIHLERDRLAIWYGYGFEAERSKQLQDAMRQYVRSDVKAPVIGLRGPDHAALSNAAAVELSKLASGTAAPDKAIEQLITVWKEIDAKVPKDDRLRWRKMAAGAN